MMDHGGLGCQPDWEGLSSVHVDGKAGWSGRRDVCRVYSVFFCSKSTFQIEELVLV